MEQNKTYTLEEAMRESICIVLTSKSEKERILGALEELGHMWANGKKIRKNQVEQVLFSIGLRDGVYHIFFPVAQPDSINSTLISTENTDSDILNRMLSIDQSDNTITIHRDDSQFPPKTIDLNEGDVFYNLLYSEGPLKVVKGENGQLYGIDANRVCAFQVDLQNRWNSFTPYKLEGFSIERPMVYPIHNSKVMRYKHNKNTLIFEEVLFRKEMEQEFKEGRIITIEEYYKLASEYNSKLKNEQENKN